MNTRRRNLILVAAVAGLTSGFTVRWIQRGGTQQNASSGSARSAISQAVSAPDSASPHSAKKTSPFVTALKQQLTVSSGVTRWLEWMSALEHAKVTDFPSMVRMTKSNPIALRMIAARWIELDPNHLFNTLIASASEVEGAGTPAFPRYELGQQLMEDWVARDPAAAIAALSRADYPSVLRDLRFNVLNSIMKKDPELGLKTMSAWHIDNYGVDPKSFGRWAEANPRHAAEFALVHTAGYTTQSAMGEIGKAWAKTDPEAALTFAAGCKDKYGLALANGIVAAWAAKDLGKAAAWLAAADPAVRGRFSGPMVELWAKTDTAGAMNWIQDNLKGSGLDEAIGSVLKGAADKDVASAAELVSGMDATMGRAKAALSVAKKWFPGFDSGKPAPPEAISWLSSLDPGSIKHVMEQLQWQWAGSDPKSLCDFLLTPAGQNSPAYSFYGTAREMARKDPVAALEWAGKLPDERRVDSISNVISEWQNSQPAAAMEWLRKLPASDPRRESYFRATIRDYFPGGPEADVVAKALASGNNTAAREAVQKLSIPDEHKDKLLTRLQLK
ncbi:MAG TPA: hypothetical protein VG796_09110 [Verrucomicrobiales bacterium]|nr:hypothetical protein [Verrucomicrobiales bacterium]